MSRIGRKPIAIPAGVEVKLADGVATVKGPKGTLTQAIHPNMKVEVVKNGDTRDLGGKTLTFLSAPFLHWPDSIFTYLPEDKVVFTCDFLGAHYCEPLVWDNKVT